jgi:hypothetical protein
LLTEAAFKRLSKPEEWTAIELSISGLDLTAYTLGGLSYKLDFIHTKVLLVWVAPAFALGSVEGIDSLISLIRAS